MARLSASGAAAKANATRLPMKVGKSLGYDPNPGDLLVGKVKSLQRGMEA